MKILITGHKGFIGKHLKNALEKNGISFSVFSEELKHLEKSSIKSDIVIHLAEKSRGVDNDLLQNSNLESLGYVLAFAKKNNSLIVYPSSASVYQPKFNTTKLIEASELNETSESGYIRSKQKAEKLLLEEHPKCIILRLFNIYGPGQNLSFIIPQIIDSLLYKKPMRINNPKYILDFLHVDDFCSLIIEIINSANILLGEVYNIGSGVGVALETLVYLFQRKLLIHESQIEFGKNNECNAYIADIEKIKSRYNWNPRDINNVLENKDNLNELLAK